ncbi:MAG: KTSC domain-containing protein [Flammeovirgaceae bacterium]|nr:KTSC domain-containing protein [Flammeovirgaceae bacterium]MDW8287425.1 KTSC domain-containing protein [Flammeovirgaceae bacterium]
MQAEILKEKFLVKSSLVEYLVYDYEKRTLEVKYKSGKHKGQTCVYKNFSQDHLKDILRAESVGKELLKILNKKKESISWWGYILEKIR